ncbi:MAG: ribosome-associated translation inhibitor RaiA [Bacteroidaceae bacterium]|nr:ribosome-associated translation inhibitor RaiA [Bacteroidaceae bacterium]MBO7588531.1 ribosome-associated translation inhibitor RaiA [Bacteroidaceae bacterium]MBP5646828.1 ribosome-associated translation inhibitor RaiA [Bacteroidaceae bacterium]
METKIQALHFNATEQLQAFIEKKCAKLERVHELIRKVEVVLRVIKPETSLNKQASITVTIPNGELFAEKICDTFEQAVDECLDALTRQLKKNKEKQREK